MRSLEPVDLDALETAPTRVSVVLRVEAPRERVFDEVARHPARWGQWFAGFGHEGHWDTTASPDVGSVRVMRAFSREFRETILAWDDGARWAFRVDETNAPVLRSLIENWGFTDGGPGTTILTWTCGIDFGRLTRLAGPVLYLGSPALLRRAARRLGAIAVGRR